MIVSATATELLSRMPGPATAEWPRGEPYTTAFARGTMSVGLYAPVGTDPQTPHEQDEVYIIRTGTGTLIVDGKRLAATAGTALFVPAGAQHRFEDLSTAFSTWVVFWGPPGGEEHR